MTLSLLEAVQAVIAAAKIAQRDRSLAPSGALVEVRPGLLKRLDG